MPNKVAHSQAFFFTLLNYVGILIGVFSTLLIYPQNRELLGIFRYVESLAQILFPILLFGLSQVLIKFNPKLNQKEEKQLFNYAILSVVYVSTLVFLLIQLLPFFSVVDDLNYLHYAFCIAIFLAFIDLFKKQASILQKIAVPTFFDNIVPKITLPIIFLLVLSNYTTENESLTLYIISFALIAVFVAIYLSYYFRPTFDFNFKSLFTTVKKTDMYRFSFFAFSGSLGSVFAFRIDALMIPKFLSMTDNGTFSIGVTLASALAIPATGIFMLYAPLISNYLKNDAIAELDVKYKEISKLLFFVGALLYSCIFIGIENLFMLLPTPDNLMASVPVILILGLSVLINMGTGFNGEIITYSKYYKFNLIAIFVLIVINVSLNLLFVQVFHLGIEGFAFASLIAMVLFNLSKLLFIYQKFKILPFDYSYLKLVLVFLTTFLLSLILPIVENGILNLLYKIIFSLCLNLVLVYKFKLVFSYASWVDKAFLKIKNLV
jgi:O-antigen/teichoic acid export membrane protein